MRDFLAYLAGPIDGLTYGEGQSWREYVMARLPKEIRGVSPLRAKSQRLSRVGVIRESYEDNPLTSSRDLTSRDRMDCTRCDILVMNLLGAQKVSIGTMIEIGWADINRIPIILVMEKSGNVHEHPMVRECAAFRVETLDEAIAVAEAVLMPEGVGTARDNVKDLVQTEAPKVEQIQTTRFPQIMASLKCEFDPKFDFPKPLSGTPTICAEPVFPSERRPAFDIPLSPDPIKLQ